MRNGLPFSKPKVRLFGDPGEAQQYLGEAYNLLFQVRQFCEQSGVPVFSMRRQLPNGALVTAAIVGGEEIVAAHPPGFTVQAGRERQKPKIPKQHVYVFGANRKYMFNDITIHEQAVIEIPFDQLTGKMSLDKAKVVLRGPAAPRVYGTGFGIDTVAALKGKVAYHYNESVSYTTRERFVGLSDGTRVYDFSSDDFVTAEESMVRAGKDAFGHIKYTGTGGQQALYRFSPTGEPLSVNTFGPGLDNYVYGGSLGAQSDAFFTHRRSDGYNEVVQAERTNPVWSSGPGQTVYFVPPASNKKRLLTAEHAEAPSSYKVRVRDLETKSTQLDLTIRNFNGVRQEFNSAAITHDFFAVLHYDNWDTMREIDPYAFTPLVEHNYGVYLSLYRTSAAIAAQENGETPTPVDTVELKLGFSEFNMTRPYSVHFDGADVFGPTPAQQLELAELALPL